MYFQRQCVPKVSFKVPNSFCIVIVFTYLIIILSEAKTKDGLGEAEASASDEGWVTWVNRFTSLFHSGMSSSSFNDKDPNEGWGQWSRRQGCKLLGMECCLPPDIRTMTFIPRLRKALQQELIGQHLASEIILNSIAAHWSGDPRRPLVLSFHGWTGSGKTYLAQHIAKALYRKGEESFYYRHFMQGYDFHDQSDYTLATMRAKLQHDLISVARRCDYALFVFDEVDNMSPKVLDALVPFLDYPATVGDVSFRKAIFILLNNVGSNVIANTTRIAWEAGKTRESLTIHDFESAINYSSFNEKESGLYRCKLIDKNLIDYSIPFLPMEKRHVKQCVEHEARRQGVAGIDADEIASTLEYWPKKTPLFSTSGCKRVERAVALWKSKNSITTRSEL